MALPVSIAGVEGPPWFLADYDIICKVLYGLCEDPQFRGGVTISRQPDDPTETPIVALEAHGDGQSIIAGIGDYLVPVGDLLKKLSASDYATMQAMIAMAPPVVQT